jgi:hypothetical protein
MLIKAIWEDCDFLNGEWSNKKNTSFWLEIPRGERQRVVDASCRKEDLNNEIDINTSISDSVFFLLVSRDLTSITCLPHFYPFSPQWNGYSPFREIPDIEIHNLNELQYIEIDGAV